MIKSLSKNHYNLKYASSPPPLKPLRNSLQKTRILLEVEKERKLTMRSISKTSMFFQRKKKSERKVRHRFLFS